MMRHSFREFEFFFGPTVDFIIHHVDQFLDLMRFVYDHGTLLPQIQVYDWKLVRVNQCLVRLSNIYLSLSEPDSLAGKLIRNECYAEVLL